MATKKSTNPQAVERCYFVAVDTLLPSGQRLLHDRISRPIARVSTCRRVLKRLQRRNRDAFMVQVTQFR